MPAEKETQQCPHTSQAHGILVTSLKAFSKVTLGSALVPSLVTPKVSHSFSHGSWLLAGVEKHSHLWEMP